MKITITPILIALFFCNALSQEYQDWKYLHPRPQANNLRNMQMLDANNWLAVGQYGTFTRTTNGGQNWYFHHFAGKIGPALDAGNAIDLWFFNLNTGIVVGERGYVGRTTNSGVTFDSVAIGLVTTSRRCQTVWFADQNTGFVGAGSPSGFGGDILKTTNGGLNWASVYTTVDFSVTSLEGTNAQTVYAVLASGDIMKTTDGGSNWVTSTGVIPQFMYDISFVNSSTGFVCGSLGKVSRTTNAGASWDSLSRPQLNDWAFYQIKIVSAGEIYLTGDPGFIYKSTNLGTNWTPIPISVPNLVTFVWYSMGTAGSTMTVAGDYGIVIKSTDNGATWSTNHYQVNTQIMFDIQSLPGTPRVWVAGRPDLLLGRQILYSSNYGNNWTSFGTGSTEEIYTISMINANTGFISGQYSKVFKTVNGGINWTPLTNASGSNYNLNSSEFIDENTGWVFTSIAPVSGGVFKTTNGGLNWNQYLIAGATTQGILSADMVNAGTGFVSLNSSNRPVYKTTDGGLNWTAFTTPLTGIIYDVKALDQNNLYIAASSGTTRMAKSTNGGANWTSINLPITLDCRSIDFKDVNTGYVCGNLTSAVCRTSDGGSTWTFQNIHLPTLIKVHVSSGDTAFVTGTYAAILRAAGSNLTSVHYNGNTIPAAFELQQNYPNPFNPSTKIRFSLPRQGNVDLRIFDIRGREIYSPIRNMNLNAGIFTVDFNGAGLSSGIYFYSLVFDGNIKETRKMVLVK